MQRMLRHHLLNARRNMLIFQARGNDSGEDCTNRIVVFLMEVVHVILISLE